LTWPLRFEVVQRTATSSTVSAGSGAASRERPPGRARRAPSADRPDEVRHPDGAPPGDVEDRPVARRPANLPSVRGDEPEVARREPLARGPTAMFDREFVSPHGVPSIATRHSTETHAEAPGERRSAADTEGDGMAGGALLKELGKRDSDSRPRASVAPLRDDVAIRGDGRLAGRAACPAFCGGPARRGKGGRGAFSTYPRWRGARTFIRGTGGHAASDGARRKGVRRDDFSRDGQEGRSRRPRHRRLQPS